MILWVVMVVLLGWTAPRRLDALGWPHFLVWRWRSWLISSHSVLVQPGTFM